MATSSHITMLREISAAGARERTGALDVEWVGAHASFFFMFGHPSHVVYETTDGRKLDGEPALDAILEELPAEFRVAPWRRAMVTDDTLHCSAEDLMGLFQRRHAAVDNNQPAAQPPAPERAPTEAFAPPLALAESAPTSVPFAPPGSTEQPQFGLRDFPLLPLATALWTDAAANVAGLEAALSRLPDSVLVLAGPTCRGVAVINGGRIADAVWVSATGGRLGDAAGHAVMTSLEGTLTAYRFDDPRIVATLPLLWRSPRLGLGVPALWLHADDVVAEVRTSARSCALLVDSADGGVALFADGELVAVYTDNHPWPATSMAALRSLLHEPGALVSVIGDLQAASEASAEADSTIDTAEAEAPAAVAAEDDAPANPAPVEKPSATTEDDSTVATVEATAALDEAPSAAEDLAALEAQPAPEPPAEDVAALPTKGRGRARGRSKAEAKADAKARADVATTAAETEVEVGVEPVAEPALAEPVAEFVVADVESEPASDLRFEPAVFTIADLSTATDAEAESAVQSATAVAANDMTDVEAREATEFVPARLDIDVDALRAELTDIATVWLGEDDAAPVAKAIGVARPGVDDFVSTIAAISSMEIPGHESAVVRAMAREMHFRASEVLCGV